MIYFQPVLNYFLCSPTDCSGDTKSKIQMLVNYQKNQEEADRVKESLPESNPAVPDVKQVALTIARFYLRNYLANSDPTRSSSIQLDTNSIDPNDNPDNLADMVEQVKLIVINIDQ